MPKYHDAGQVAQAIATFEQQPNRLFGAPATYEGSPYQPNADVGETLSAGIKSLPIHFTSPVAALQPGAGAPSLSLSWTTKFFGGNPASVSISIQGSNTDVDGSYSTIDTSTVVGGETRTKTAQAFKFFRAIVNSASGGSTFEVFLTITQNAGG